MILEMLIFRLTRAMGYTFVIRSARGVVSCEFVVHFSACKRQGHG